MRKFSAIMAIIMLSSMITSVALTTDPQTTTSSGTSVVTIINPLDSSSGSTVPLNGVTLLVGAKYSPGQNIEFRVRNDAASTISYMIGCGYPIKIYKSENGIWNEVQLSIGCAAPEYWTGVVINSGETRSVYTWDQRDAGEAVPLGNYKVEFDYDFVATTGAPSDSPITNIAVAYFSIAEEQHDYKLKLYTDKSNYAVGETAGISFDATGLETPNVFVITPSGKAVDVQFTECALGSYINVCNGYFQVTENGQFMVVARSGSLAVYTLFFAGATSTTHGGYSGIITEEVVDNKTLYNTIAVPVSSTTSTTTMPVDMTAVQTAVSAAPVIQPTATTVVVGGALPVNVTANLREVLKG